METHSFWRLSAVGPPALPQTGPDEDYNPNPSDLAAESSIASVGDDSSMEEDNRSDQDEILDMQTLNFPGREWTAESYSNARSMNQYNLARDTNVLFFHSRYNMMHSLGT